MNALLVFENGKKVYEELSKNSEYLFKKMMETSGNILLVSQDGKRLQKGKIPSTFKKTFSWIK